MLQHIQKVYNCLRVNPGTGSSLSSGKWCAYQIIRVSVSVIAVNPPHLE